ADSGLVTVTVVARLSHEVVLPKMLATRFRAARGWGRDHPSPDPIPDGASQSLCTSPMHLHQKPEIRSQDSASGRGERLATRSPMSSPRLRGKRSPRYATRTIVLFQRYAPPRIMRLSVPSR